MLDDIGLKKTILVTGGSTGIGYAVAEELLKLGNNVFICGRRPDALDLALKNLKKSYKNHVNGVTCDVAKFSEVDRMINHVIEEFGCLDVLINNAGIAFICPFEDISVDSWIEIINTNLTGVFNCCKAALPYLKKSAFADIVNVGSRSGRYSYAGGVGYNATKFGLQGMTEALFLDLSKYGVRVSLVAPGTVSTGLGGTIPEDWHLTSKHVAQAIICIIGTDRAATLNWVEIRPSKIRITKEV
jgi:3-oxoacyl-[acyl-carrier protein] reductase